MASISVSSRIYTTNDSLNLNTCTGSVTVTEQSYDIANNTSVVKVSYSASITSNRTFTGTSRPQAGYLRVTVNSVQHDFTMPFNNGMHLGSSICSGEYTQTVSHNNDGSKTVGFSVQIVSGTDPRNYGVVWVTTGVVTGTQALTNIPRASKPTFASNPLTIGSTQVISTNRASDSFTHTIKIDMDEYSTTATGVGASLSWEAVETTLMPYMDVWKKTVTVTCTTYSGSTQIGSAQTATFYLQVDTTRYGPTLDSCTLSDANTLTNQYTGGNAFIRGKSKLKAVVATSLLSTAYNYSLKNVMVSYGSEHGTYAAPSGASSFTATFLQTGTAGPDSLTVSVADSKNYAKEQAVAVTVLPYSDVVIRSVNLVRVNANNVETETGEYLRYTIVVNGFSGSFGSQNNFFTIESKYKGLSDADYSLWTTEQTVTTSSTGVGSVTDVTITGVTVGTYASNLQFNIIFRVTDAFSQNECTPIRVHEGVPVFSWGPDFFDIYGELHIHDREDIESYRTLSPTGYAWTLAGTAVGTTAIPFDSTVCSEILVVTKYYENANNDWIATAIVPVDQLTAEGLVLMMPARIYSSAPYDKGCLVKISTTSARLDEWYSNRTSVLSNATLAIYYR